MSEKIVPSDNPILVPKSWVGLGWPYYGLSWRFLDPIQPNQCTTILKKEKGSDSEI